MYIFYIIIAIILSGCSTSLGPGDKYMKNISQKIETDYGIKHGELIAKYDLLPSHRAKNLCLFAQDFGDVVSTESRSISFLERIRSNPSNLEYVSSYAENKAESIYKRLHHINTKFKFFKEGELAKFRIIKRNNRSVFDIISSNLNQERYKVLNNLLSADSKIKQIPVFLPQTYNKITSNFGYRNHPLTGKKIMHQGTDFASKKHSMIYASADGKVVDIAHSKSYGTFIIIDHQYSFKTRYAHLSKLHTRIGDTIFQGQLIARQGKTGLATSDHLHFEILHQNIPIDPMIFVGSEYYCRNHSL
ncbi:MAG: hypothetical protein RLZZ59_746 [Pseudomonadota bacterium]|jgi:murein DD-endopeptidase MepM/ murein hydrolase activator NlpD